MNRHNGSKRLFGLTCVFLLLLFGTIFLSGAIGAAAILCIIYYNAINPWLIAIIGIIGIIFICCAIGIIKSLITNFFNQLS